MNKTVINIVLVLLISGCDLFSSKTSMGNGYFFVTIDASNRYIFREHEGIRVSVVKPTIVASGRFEGYAFILRQPRKDSTLETIDGKPRSDVKFERQCEFFVINIEKATIKGPLDIKKYKEEVSSLNICDKCLRGHTVSPPINYCIEKKDIVPLIDQNNGSIDIDGVRY